MALSIGGIVLMAYTAGFGGPSAVGIVLSLGSAIGAALYKVKILYFDILTFWKFQGPVSKKPDNSILGINMTYYYDL